MIDNMARIAHPTDRLRDQPPAILLGGGIIAVPVARSLARAGVPVIALGARQDPVRNSRACREFVELGSGAGVQERSLDWLAQRAEVGAVVLPCNDDGVELCATHRNAIVELGYRPAESDPDAALAILDKERTYEIARRIGVPAPRTALAVPGDDAGVAAGMRFPVALKPRKAHLFVRHFGLRRKVLLAEDDAQLTEHLQQMRELNLEMLITEIIPGPEDSFHSFYAHMDERGESFIRVTKRKLRQYPAHFGLASYHVMTREEEVADLGMKFFRGVGLRGTGVVEFKRDARDGTLKLIEANARFSAGTELLHHSGVDLARIAYDRALGRPVTAVRDYRAGLHMWLPIEDIRAAFALRREGELTTREWLTGLCHRQHFPLWSWRDPLPTVHSFGRKVTTLTYRLGARATRTSTAELHRDDKPGPIPGGRSSRRCDAETVTQ